MLIRNLLAATLFLTATAHAAPERYTLDPAHTDVVWFTSHMGFSDSHGSFEGVKGTLLLDEENPEMSRLDAVIDISGLNTGQEDFTEHLLSDDFFDAEKYPTARFVSETIELTSEEAANVHGKLTLHGVTKPVTLDVTLNKIGENPMAKKQVAGFSARTVIKRSDFGMTTYLPAVGDEVKLVIEAEALKAGGASRE